MPIRGTAEGTRSKIWNISGKTGTAFIAEAHGYSHTRYNSSFSAASHENPRLVVVCVIHDPDRTIAHYGGKVAVPAAVKFVQRPDLHGSPRFARPAPPPRRRWPACYMTIHPKTTPTGISGPSRKPTITHPKPRPINKHRVTVAEKTISLSNRLPINPSLLFQPGHRRHHRDKSAPRKMKIGHQRRHASSDMADK